MGNCNQPLYYGAQNGSQSHNDTVHYGYSNTLVIFYCFILPIFHIFVYISGIFGNGMVIWLLGFHIKKSQFTTYILNLAIADFLVLTVSNIIITCYSGADFISPFFFESFFFIFSTSECFLTVISVDRCISIFFPLWYRCHQPKLLSTIVCALIWIFFCLSPAIISINKLSNIWTIDKIILIIFLGTGVLSFPLMTISSLMIFIKVFCKAKQHKRKILITILIVVFFFLFLCFPVTVCTVIFLLFWKDLNLIEYVMLCGCLNSSINPLIYYLVGRRKKRHSKKSMKAALQELFKEEEI